MKTFAALPFTRHIYARVAELVLGVTPAATPGAVRVSHCFIDCTHIDLNPHCRGSLKIRENWSRPGHVVVARFFGLPVGQIEIADDGSGKTEIGSIEQLPLIDQIAVCLAGVAAQDLFGFSPPEAGRADYRKIIGLVEWLTEADSLKLRDAAYVRAQEIIKNQQSEVERLAELLIGEQS